MLLPPTILGINTTVLKWTVIAALVAAAVLATYRHGRHVAEGEVAAAQLDIAIAYAGQIVENIDKADALAAQNDALRAAQAPKDRTIIKEVTRYEFLEPPGNRCTLPGTWRLLHDAAATGQPPATEAGPLATGSADPVEDTTALQTLADNYIACRDTAAKLEAWKRRYHAIEAAHEKTD
ncbi:MAG: hypothetical protein WA049_06710 [Ferribacterium limneticum]